MKKLKFGFIFVLLICFMLPINNARFSNAASIDDLSLTSKSALLIEYETGSVIYDKNSEERLPIASMTKIASLAVIFDYIDKGIVKATDYLLVSENAASVGGSSAFLDAGSKYKVTDLIKTIIVSSANDSTVALAEFIAGSEELFVSKMNKFAENLGLKNTHFVNSTGLPVDDHYSTAFDMAKIYKTICNHELYKKYSKIWMEDFIHPSGRKTGLVNTNRLIKTYDGIEGGKTGYTDKARYCLTASASRQNTRLIGVIIGADDSKTRFAEMSKMFNYGFANYETKVLVNKDFPTTILTIKNAKNKSTVHPEHEIIKFMPKNNDFEFSTDYEIFDLKAPIKAGEVVGKLFVFDKNNMVIDEVDLIIDSDINEIGLKDSLSKIVNLW